VCLSLGWCVVTRSGDGTWAAPAPAAEAAHALRQARDSSAHLWAPEALTLAEETYRRGMAELRRQENRPAPFRALEAVMDTLALARERARQAAREGRERMEASRAEAGEALAEAAELLEMLDEVEAGGALPRDVRGALLAARMGFVEASTLLDAGDYRLARDRARDVRDRTRGVLDVVGEALMRFSDEDRVRTWRGWIEETVAWSQRNQAVAIVVVKERHVLDVYRSGRRILSFSADMGSNNLAQKSRQGDRATPEGRFRIRQLKEGPHTRYYRAFLLDYPTPEDLRRIQAAKEAGIIPAGAGPGALIEIHGDGGRGEDWTNGCVAVTNAQMDELFSLVRVGTPVTIVGGDGSEGAYSSLVERFRRED
jgi:lipoprotein-anchoring transpeptidase ErfK/SrfK